MSNKRGRKAGAVSFCKVTLAELNRVLKPTAHVMVSVKYAALVGLSGTAMKSDTSSIQNAVTSNTCEIKIEDFNETKQDTEESLLKPQIVIEKFHD